MSEQEEDYSNIRGVLDGDAFRSFEKIEEKVNGGGEGYDFILTCQNCSRPVTVTIPWEELVVASVPGAQPINRENGQRWQFFQGFLYPSVFCPCGFVLQVPMTPDKCQRMVRTGVNMGRLNAQQVDQMRANIQAQLQTYRR